MSDRDISEIKDSLARLETHLPAIIKIQEDHETRIRFLEKYAFILLGIAVLVPIGLKLLIK